MSVLLRLCFSLVLLVPAPALALTHVLENPGNGSFYSGIGVVSGWKCTANGPLTVRFNGGDPIALAYGNERADVREAGACPSADVGFVSIMNWGNLGDGTHTAVVYDNSVEFARSTFTVATTGESFVRGAEGECRVPDFPAPGETMQFSWNEATQHLEMVSVDGRNPEDRFRDCHECPEMVVVPAGSYLMGSPVSEVGRYKYDNREGPQHVVTIATPFAVGAYEVTHGEFAEFVSATGYSAGNCWRNTGYNQTDRHPVTCVNWHDAQAYVGWLSQKTGHLYRLLSEAEWEYVARAGTQTARYWGESSSEQCRYANGADQTFYEGRGMAPAEGSASCADSYVWTAPVGTYEANGFGLYDVYGNALEWLQDCWNNSYSGAPTDGRAWEGGDCSWRLTRGSSYNDITSNLRSAARFPVTPLSLRNPSLGFRITRSLSQGDGEDHSAPAKAAMATATEQGVLENPGNGSFYSGVGVVSGWKCTANGPLTVRFNDGDASPLAYGNERPDVREAGACPSADVGFVSIMNWANLGDGSHTAVAYDNGVEFARSTFEIATTGESFVRGAEGECRVPDFPAPGESMRFAWNQSTQHLEMVSHRGGGGSGSGGGGGPLGKPWSEATVVRLSSGTRGTLSSDTRGTLEQADDVNYYRLDIPDAGTVTVDTTGNTDTIGQLRTGPTGTAPGSTGSDGREVGRDDGAGSGNNFRISQPLPAGTYYILVSGRTPGDYTLRVRFTPDQGCAADNVGDTPDSAAIVVLDQTVREALECEGDNDYFRVSVPRAGILDVKTWDHESGLDLEYDDLICHDGHLCLAVWAPSENDGNHATNTVKAGTYYIRIRDRSPIPYVGPYQLNVRLHPLQDDHGDSGAAATAVSVPSVTQGIIETLDRHDTQHGNYPTDVDVFEIALPEKPPESYTDFTWERQITITIEGETLLQAKLIKVPRTVLERTRDKQSDGPIEFTETQRGGVGRGDTLWLEVAGADGTVHNTGPYTVRISMEENNTGAPGIPRNVRVTGQGEDYIDLDWDPPAGGGAASYNVYYRLEGGTETLLGSVDTSGARATGIGDTREICYRVSAVNAAGVEGEKSAEACGSVAPAGGGSGVGIPAITTVEHYCLGEWEYTDPPPDKECNDVRILACEEGLSCEGSQEACSLFHELYNGIFTDCKTLISYYHRPTTHHYNNHCGPVLPVAYYTTKHATVADCVRTCVGNEGVVGGVKKECVDEYRYE